MYNIAFQGDEKYIKYIAVVIGSIVNSTDKNKKIIDFQKAINKEIHGENFISNDNLENTEEGYVFHILSDFISDETKEKLEKLAEELSKIYPVAIKTYILSDKEFRFFPTWHKSYLCYYRLKIPELVPADIEKILYLDGDMLVCSDVRELFAIDMNNDIMLPVTHSNYLVKKFKKQTTLSNCPYTAEELSISHLDDIICEGKYFNNGFFMMNLANWRNNKVTEKAMYYLHNYHLPTIEQDALNIILNHNYKELSIAWNLSIYHCFDLYDKLIKQNNYTYESEECLDILKNSDNIRNIHYCSYQKPWLSLGLFIISNKADMRYAPFIELWWKTAENLPIFQDELKAIKTSKIYMKNIAKEQRIIALSKNPIAFKIYITIRNINQKIQPMIRAVEKPIKQVRNKIRGKLAK